MRRPRLPKMRRPQFLRALDMYITVTTGIALLFVGMTVMNLLFALWWAAVDTGTLAFLFFIDSKKWQVWKHRERGLESELHAGMTAVHMGGLLMQEALRCGDSDTVKQAIDRQLMMTEAYLLSRHDIDVKVAPDDAG